MNLLGVRPYLCTGCRTCELACAFAHSGSATGVFHGHSRVSVREAAGGVHVPLLCLQCDQALCMSVCAYAALMRSDATGAIELDPARCTRCLLCTVACPMGNIAFDPATREVVKCDLCHGDPACARFCPTGTIRWEAPPAP